MPVRPTAMTWSRIPKTRKLASEHNIVQHPALGKCKLRELLRRRRTFRRTFGREASPAASNGHSQRAGSDGMSRMVQPKKYGMPSKMLPRYGALSTTATAKKSISLIPLQWFQKATDTRKRAVRSKQRACRRRGGRATDLCGRGGLGLVECHEDLAHEIVRRTRRLAASPRRIGSPAPDIGLGDGRRSSLANRGGPH
jgi:hypothetical protein